MRDHPTPRRPSLALTCALALGAACASRARAPTAAAPQPTPPRAAAAPDAERDPHVAPPLFYGVVTVAEHRVGGPALLVAGNLRVAVAADGAVTVAAEAPSSFIAAQRPLTNGAWAFVTTDEQVLVTESFTGPITQAYELPRRSLKLGTGAVASVRTDDGVWHAALDSGNARLTELGDAAWGLHFLDARRAIALRAPGEVVLSRDGGDRWEALALAGDVPLDFAVADDGTALVRGARRHYRLTGDALVAAPDAPPAAPAPAPSDDAVARWNDWWRAHLWPRGAPSFWLSDGGVRVQAREHRGALYWTTAGAVERLRRDGTRERVAVPHTAPCTHTPFGARLLLRCHDRGDEVGSGLYTLDADAFTLARLPATLNARTIVTPADDGSALALADGDPSSARRRVWTEATGAWHDLTLPEAELELDLRVGKAIAYHRFVAYAVPLDGSRATLVSAAPARDGAAPARVTRLLAATVRGDGGYAVLTEVEGADDRCALHLGTDARSLVRTEVADCGAVDALLFADARFGARVETTGTWVTRDGGAHWTAISRPLGVPAARRAQELRGLRPSVLLAEGIAVSPHRLLASEPDDAEGAETLWRTTELDLGESEVDDHVDGVPQRCAPFGAPRPQPPERATADARTFALWHQGTRLEVSLTRAAGAVRARLAWAGGSSTRGAFGGEAPWRDALADFERPAAVGYALRAAGAGGVLVERCLGARTGIGFDPAACDVRWVTPAGAVVPMALQQAPDEAAGARIDHAAADGAGWVVELASMRGGVTYGWSQWQHWAADGTLARWGDVRRDLALHPYVALARIEDAWGTIEGGERGAQPERAFVPHGGARTAPFEAPMAVGFCPRAAMEGDLWLHEGDGPYVIPVASPAGRARVTLAVDPAGAWCVARVDTTSAFDRWTSADAAHRRPFWTSWLAANGRATGGHGAAVWIDGGGRATERSLRCEAGRVPNEDFGEE